MSLKLAAFGSDPFVPKEHESQTNRDVIRTAGRERGDPNAGVLPDKEVSRNANEPSS